MMIISVILLTLTFTLAPTDANVASAPVGSCALTVLPIDIYYRLLSVRLVYV